MAIKIEENVLLRDYSTMRVGGPAKYLVHAGSKEDVEDAVQFAKDKGLDILAIGDGANILFADSGYDGLVIVLDIKGFEVLKGNNDTVIKVGAGENWDETVRKTVEMGLSGMEAMSLIPGTVGATPVMNVGAYGQEISEIIESVSAYDLKESRPVTLAKEDCGFGYRGSRFSREDSERFIITEVALRLHHNRMKPPFYRDVEKYFEENGITDYSPSAVRDAVIHIRTRKLPDPKKVGTSGSFFKNPVVSRESWDVLVKKFPDLDAAGPQWPQKPRWFLEDGNVKIAAARLIELAELDNYRKNGVYLWPTQHLTIVNKGAESAKDIIEFKNKIKEVINKKFGILLDEEVRVID